MAATVSAWAKPGAWALDSEENEAELLQQQKEEASNGGTDSGLSDFPSLSSAAAAATKAKKKSKGQTLSLQQFVSGSSVKQPNSQPSANKGLTHDELLALPTAPRQRSAEELDRSKLGGGFRSYGSSYGRGSSDEQSRRPRESSRDFAPSRADEIDDWGAAKKSTVGNGFERRERGERGGFFSDSQSRADEVDNWASKKSFVPSEGRRHERRGGVESNGGGVDTDNWTKRKEDEGKRFGASGGAFDSLRERRGVGFEPSNGQGLDSDNWGRKREEGGGRPRLNLQPRTLPVGEGQLDNGNAAKPKGSNPFGDARPREEVLKEKGQDPKEIEEELESEKIKEPVGSKSTLLYHVFQKLRIICVEGVQLAISSALDILSSNLPVLSKKIQVTAAGLLWLLLAIRDAILSFGLSNADLGRDDKQISKFRNFIDSILSEHSLSHEQLLIATLESLLSIACQFEGRYEMDAVRQFAIQSKDLIRSKPKVLLLNFLKALLQGAPQFTNILQQLKNSSSMVA